jgi:hypothetical protein
MTWQEADTIAERLYSFYRGAHRGENYPVHWDDLSEETRAMLRDIVLIDRAIAASNPSQ